MLTLTVFGKDDSKQVINCNNTVLFDEKNRRLTPDDLSKKMRTIATDVAKNNYLNHKFRNQN